MLDGGGVKGVLGSDEQKWIQSLRFKLFSLAKEC